jgi:hypothetical protein
MSNDPPALQRLSGRRASAFYTFAAWKVKGPAKKKVDCVGAVNDLAVLKS